MYEMRRGVKKREELQAQCKRKCKSPQILALKLNDLPVNSHKGREQENSQNSNQYNGLVHLSLVIINCNQNIG